MRRVSWLIAMFGLITGYTQAFAQPRVTAMAPLTISLPAGSSLIVTLQGRELDKIASAQVVLGASAAPGVTAQLGPAVSASRTVTITAGVTAAPRPDYQLQLRQAALAIAPVATIPVAVTVAIALNSLAVNPAAVTGGQLVRVTLSLTGPAPAGGVLVTLRVDKPTIRLPALSVQIVAGRTEVTFDLLTAPVAASTPTVVTAEYGRVAKTATVTIQPPTLAAVSVSPQTVTGGTAATGTVTLTGPAPAGGVVVPLVSSLNAAAAVPQSTTVAAGQITGTFQIATTPLPKNTLVTISAGQGAAAKTASLTVNPLPSITSFSIAPNPVVGGNPVAGTVTLSAPAAGTGQQVFLRVNQDRGFVTPPSSFTISGGQTTGTFQITTGRPVNTDGSPADNGPGNITAETGNQPGVQAFFTVQGVRLSRVVFEPGTGLMGRNAAGRVELNLPAPPSGIRVQLACSSSHPSVPCSDLPGPFQITIPGGQTSGSFSMGLPQPSPPQPESFLVSYTASSSDALGNAAGNFTARRLVVSSLTFSSASVPGGTPVTTTVGLREVAPESIPVVIVASPTAACFNTGVDPRSWVPGNLTIPSGQQSATFTIATEPPTCDLLLRVEAAAMGGSTPATLQVQSARVISVTVSPPVVVGGQSATVTITLDNTVPPSATAVTLTKFDPEFVAGLSPASSFGMPAGQTTVTLPVTTKVVSSSKSITIGASRAGAGVKQTEVRAILTVNPQ